MAVLGRRPALLLAAGASSKRLFLLGRAGHLCRAQRELGLPGYSVRIAAAVRKPELVLHLWWFSRGLCL